MASRSGPSFAIAEAPQCHPGSDTVDRPIQALEQFRAVGIVGKGEILDTSLWLHLVALLPAACTIAVEHAERDAAVFTDEGEARMSLDPSPTKII